MAVQAIYKSRGFICFDFRIGIYHTVSLLFYLINVLHTYTHIHTHKVQIGTPSLEGKLSKLKMRYQAT